MSQITSPADLNRRDVFRLAWPMTLKAVFLHGTIVIDGWMVSSLGEVALAAMGIAGALAGIALGVLFAFSHAMQIRTAQVFGGRNRVHLKSVIAAGLTISGSLGVLGALVLLIAGPSMISALAPTGAIASEARTYLAIFTIVILGEAFSQCIVSYLNGCGRTKTPLIGYCISVPINVTCSYALIHGLWGLPAMGVAGAALGSALGITAQTVFLTGLLWVKDGDLRKVDGWQRETFRATIRRHLFFSLPIAATFVSANIASHLCMLIYAKMTLSAFAALTLIMPWNMVAGQISMQWAQATGIIVAQLLGNGTDETVLKRFLSNAWSGAFVASALVACVFVVMGLALDQLYPDLTEDTRIVLLTFIPLMIIIQPLRTSNAICGNTLRASGDTIYVMHIFIWSQWAFRVPLTALAVLYFNLAPVGILSLLLVEEIVKFLPFHRRLWRGTWRQANVLE